MIILLLKFIQVQNIFFQSFNTLLFVIIRNIYINNLPNVASIFFVNLFIQFVIGFQTKKENSSLYAKAIYF